MRFFEDLQQGDTLQSGGSSEEVAKASRFGARIAHGAFYGIDRMRFTRPAHIGDSIQLTKKVTAREERASDRRVVTFETNVVNQKRETVLIYYDKLPIRRRE